MPKGMCKHVRLPEHLVLQHQMVQPLQRAVHQYRTQHGNPFVPVGWDPDHHHHRGPNDSNHTDHNDHTDHDQGGHNRLVNQP